MNLHAKVDLFLADVCAGKHNETEKAYRTKLAQLERFAQSRTINEKLIKDFIHDLKTRKTHRRGYTIVTGGLSQYTIKSIIQTTRHFCKWLYDNHHMREELYKTIKVPGVPPPMPKALSADTFAALLASAIANTTEEWKRVRDVAILYYLRDTGGRVGGLTNARVSDIDLKSGEISTIEKGKNIKLYINPPTITAIQAWLLHRDTVNPFTDHLFIARYTHRGITRGGVRHMINRLADMAGIKDRRNAHSFRHAFARDFLKNGGEITQLAGIMHHSSIWVTTNYYARWNDTELMSAHAKHSPINSIEPLEV